MAGIWGAFATGVFAIQGFGVDRLGGAYYGNTAQVFLQLIRAHTDLIEPDLKAVHAHGANAAYRRSRLLCG